MAVFDNILSAALPVEEQGGDGCLWRLAEPRWRQYARRACPLLLGQAGDAQLIQHEPRRMVARLTDPRGDAPAPSLVAKVCRMQNLRQRLLRWRRYAPEEAANLLEAARRDLPVPAVMAVGLRRRGGLVTATALLMEDMAPRRSLRQLLAEHDGQVDFHRRALAAATGVFLKMHHAGCHNINFNDGSILLLPDLSEPGLVDFEYTWFLDGPDPGVLAFHAARFGVYCSRRMARELVDEWARALSEQAGVPDPQGWWALYRDLSSRSLTRRQRRRRQWQG